MRKVDTSYGYDLYIGNDRDENGFFKTVYNIVKENSPAPDGGYYNMKWIKKIKGVKFHDRYQPTKNGMADLYLLP